MYLYVYITLICIICKKCRKNRKSENTSCEKIWSPALGEEGADKKYALRNNKIWLSLRLYQGLYEVCGFYLLSLEWEYIDIIDYSIYIPCQS